MCCEAETFRPSCERRAATASMAREPGPVPPADFDSRDLPIETVRAGAAFQRIHRTGFGPLHFGLSGDNRFDDPRHEYGVFYAARSLEGAFAETCLRELG